MTTIPTALLCVLPLAPVPGPAPEPDDTCWTTEWRLCCDEHPNWLRTIPCGGDTCYPEIVLDEFVRKPVTVEEGWTLQFIAYGEDKWCKVYPALCDYTSPSIGCTVSLVLMQDTCVHHEQPAGEQNCP